MRDVYRYVLAAPALLALLIGITGCTYLQNRGNDALDIFDICFTFSSKPNFALYADFFNITPVGFSHAGDKGFGLGNRHVGLFDYQEKSWGVLFWGSESQGSGKFNPTDPHQARPSLREKVEAGEPTPEEWPRYNVGIARMLAEDDAPPAVQFFGCSRSLHLLFFGIHVKCRPGDVFDFILGWTTLDIYGDDLAGKVQEESTNQ